MEHRRVQSIATPFATTTDEGIVAAFNDTIKYAIANPAKHVVLSVYPKLPGWLVKHV